jgi:hypothetical protein
MDLVLWIVLLVIVLAIALYAGMRVGGRGHRDQKKSVERHLDEAEQPKRFWF